MSKTKRKIYNLHNKTKKVKQSNKMIECFNSFNTHDQIESEIQDQIDYLYEKNNHKKYELVLSKLFHTPYAPSKITPRSDYYTYINYSWLSNQAAELQKTKKFYTQIDSFRLVQEKVYYEIIDIVKDYTRVNKSHQAQEIKNIYSSFLNLNEKAAEKHIKNSVTMIDAFIQKNDLIRFLAYMNSNEVVSWGSPVVWSMAPDQKDSKHYRNHINEVELSVYDYELYIEDNKAGQNTKQYQQLYKRKFMQFINTLFKTCLGEKHGLKSQDVWDVEYELLIAMGCGSVKKDATNYYNIVKKDEALSQYGFDWAYFTKCLGYDETPSFFICGNLSYLKCVMALLKDNWTTAKWRTYFIYIYLRQIIRLHKTWRDIYYDFFGKFVTGQPRQFPIELNPVFGLSICFNTFLTNEYVERNKKPQVIKYVEDMSKDLLSVFKRIIMHNTWLSPKTKKYALLKLKYINIIIGSPKILRKDPLLNYTPDDPWENLIKIGTWRKQQFLKLEGKPIIDIPVVNWSSFKLEGTQAYIVNAFYTPAQNSIYIPLAYLQKPFVDLDERGIEYNLAHIGYTLGHEMSHSLDDTGSQYDYNGNLKNWWTPRDRAIFNKKVKNVIEQYELFASYDGVKMDASLSTGENLADISGLAICSQYLRDFQIKKEDINPIKAISYETFFIYIAFQARQKIYEQAIKAQLKINPHPMDKYRTNCPLARLKLFQSLYNIQKGDKMYWHSTDTIW